MANARKHKTKTKNGKFSNNMFCAVVLGIQLIFSQSLKLQFSDLLLQAIFALFNCNEWLNCKDQLYEGLFTLRENLGWLFKKYFRK